MFGSALDELYEATKLAHRLAVDPAGATYSDFEEYDRHVSEANRGLQRSNDILGRDYKTMEGVRKAGIFLKEEEY